MSRGVYLIGAGIALVALAFAVTDCVIGPTPGVTEANARRIKPGMTLREVEAILGGSGNRLAGEGHRFYLQYEYCWSGPGGTVIVSVGRNMLEEKPAVVCRGGVSFHKVQIAAFRPTTRPGFLDRLRSWLSR